MRRQELSEQLKIINEDIDRSGLAEYMRTLLARETEPSDTDSVIEEYVRSYTEYSNVVSTYTKDQIKILEIFQITDILEPSFLLASLGVRTQKDGQRSGRSLLSGALRQLYSMEGLVPQILLLIENEDRKMLELPNSERDESLKGLALLSVILIEDHHGETSPERIVLLMHAIEELYEAACRMHGLKSEKLSVLSLDSGSDKGFDFTGIGKAIEQIKEIVLGVFDRMIALRTAAKTDLLDAIERTLPALSQLKESEIKGDLSRTEAAQIRKLMLSGIEKFSSAHATIPEMKKIEASEVRQIVKREVRLIEGPKAEEGKTQRKTRPRRRIKGTNNK